MRASVLFLCVCLFQSVAVFAADEPAAKTPESTVGAAAACAEKLEPTLSVSETQSLFYGSDLFNPSPESLLGQYLAETGAKTVRRRFAVAPGSTEMGPERLVVSVSAQSFEVFRKLFARTEFMSTIGHASLLHEGQMIQFSGNKSEFRVPSSGNILPWVLLSTSEGLRLRRFLTLMGRTGGSRGVGARPWLLAGYCAAGGYSCCTHWIGNMPIGDALVDEYSFPAHQEWVQPGVDKQPKVQKLAPYQTNDPEVAKVWTVPGHMQFAEMLGQKEANLRGEFASPGWVITSLIGPTSVERVPVVFLFVTDHRVDLTPNFPFQFEAPR